MVTPSNNRANSQIPTVQAQQSKFENRTENKIKDRLYTVARLKQKKENLEAQRKQENAQGIPHKQNCQQFREQIGCIRREIQLLEQEVAQLRTDLADRKRELEERNFDQSLENNGAFGRSLLGQTLSMVAAVASVPVTIGWKLADFATKHPYIAATGVVLVGIQLFGVAATPVLDGQAHNNARRDLEKQHNKQTCETVIVRQTNYRPPKGVCSGTVVSKNKVITAQHCVSKNIWGGKVITVEPNELRVHQGAGTSEALLNDPQYSFNVINVEAHPDYINPDERTINEIHDLALVTVDRNFECEPRSIISGQNHIQFQQEKNQINHHVNHHNSGLPRTNLEAHGWGISAENRKVLSVQEKVVPMTSYHNSTEPLCDGMICAQNFENPQIDTCQGDSGGPVFWNSADGTEQELVGLVSSGDSACQGGTSLNTDLNRHRTWIEDNTINSIDECMDVQASKTDEVNKDDEKITRIRFKNNCSKPVESTFKSDCYRTKERKVVTFPERADNNKKIKTVNVADCGKGTKIRHSYTGD